MELDELALRFVRGEVPQAELGTPLASSARRIVLAPAAGLAAVELERDGEAVFAMHAWASTPVAIDLAALGTPAPLARFLPGDLLGLRFTPPDGLIVVDVDAQARAIAVHAYRFDASIAGAIASEEALMALLDFVASADFTRASIERLIGPVRETSDWRIELDPRPGANLTSATLETLNNVPNGVQLELEQAIDVDLQILRARYGQERQFISGNPPSFRTTLTFDAPGGVLMLSTYAREDGHGRAISSVIARCRGDAIAAAESTKPKVRPAPPAPLGPDRVDALVHAYFERGTDEAGMIAMLGEPIASGARTRVAPFDPDLEGAVVSPGVIEVELGAPIDPALLEPHLGASRPVAPLHAKASVAQRFYVAGPRHHGYVLVAPDRLVLRRAPRTVWLGDFTRAEGFVALVRRFVAEPTLRARDVYPMLGDPGSVIDIGSGQESVTLVPYAGGNAKDARVCRRTTDDDARRIELSLHAPLAIDFAAFGVSLAGPDPNLLAMGITQYSARTRVGIVRINIDDLRVRSTILDRER